MSNNVDDIVVELPDSSPPTSGRDFATLPRSRFDFTTFVSMLEEDEIVSEFPPPPEYTPRALTPNDVRFHSTVSRHMLISVEISINWRVFKVILPILNRICCRKS